jgi:hypothetical protein
MTELEWWNSDHPYMMLWSLKGKDSDRKMRLFAIACCRRIWHRLSDPRSRRAIEIAERYVESKVRNLERESARREARAAMMEGERDSEKDPAWALRGELVALTVSERVSANLLIALFNEKAQKQNPTGETTESVAQADLLRDLFGHLPFRSTNSNRNWLTPTVLSFAQAIYDDGTFDHLPILADALEDAGCDNADILSHCRGPGPHVRGCWVVDLLLGKK